MSRLAVLDLLIAFAMQVVEGLRTSGKSLIARSLDFARISRWIRVAIFLSARIDDGALDAPRPPRKVRVRKAAAEKDAAEPREAAEKPEREPREFEHLECYLDRPFGEVVALICKGIGMTPDWAAWANEPWAQEERRTRPPTSPHASDAARPLPPPIPRQAKPNPPPPAPSPLNRQARRAQARKQRKQLKPLPPPFRGRRMTGLTD